MRAPFVLSLGLILFAAGCSKAPDQRTFTLQGQVQSLDAAHKLVIVKHEEIKGFMPAMTMPYEVAEASAMNGLAPGDLINAKLVVFSNGAHLTDIKKVGTAPLEKPPADVPNPPTASAGFELLRPGEAVPDGKFLDQDGKATTFAAFKGSPVAMTFIYTRCPLPTFCPLMDRHFVALQKT
jgi:protein SCO1/2